MTSGADLGLLQEENSVNTVCLQWLETSDWEFQPLSLVRVMDQGDVEEGMSNFSESTENNNQKVFWTWDQN